MPGLPEPKKDVVHCAKHRGAVCGLRSGDVRMGKPGWPTASHGQTESIGLTEGTWGTETSQYPEEEKRFR
jgi:hypothetical protein